MFKKPMVGITTLLLSATAFSNDKPVDHMYPEQIDGLVKHTFVLEQVEQEADRLIEIMVSKTVETTDTCNRLALASSIDKGTVQGWGYSYYTVSADTGVASTMMACDNTEVVEREVFAARGDLYNYNSKIPLVIYAPEGVTVNYRVWAPTN